ncbi:MAG TPA: XRE family transcriptional regulator [Streptosporangiaceae bacterium]
MTVAEEHWPTLEEIEVQDRGRIDEAKVTALRECMRAGQRAHRLAEIRKAQGLTQTDVAASMHVSQRRVSAVERGDLSRTELGTVTSYVQALGGRVEIVANFGDEHIVIGLRLARQSRRNLGIRRQAHSAGAQPPRLPVRSLRPRRCSAGRSRTISPRARGPSNNGTKSGDKGLTQGMGGWLSRRPWYAAKRAASVFPQFTEVTRLTYQPR